MKSVLISIQPKWCEKIGNGEKTIEVRKTKPKLEPPFKCYIYCTQPKHPHEDYIVVFNKPDSFYAGGKVIGEFVCDRISPIVILDNCLVDAADCIFSCLSAKEILEYADGRKLYGWHISEIKIYDRPKELSDFYSKCDEGCERCGLWRNVKVNAEEFDMECSSDLYGHRPLKRPPQSWCYVEDGENDA